MRLREKAGEIVKVTEWRDWFRRKASEKRLS